jgi:hypothetical protein
MVGITTRPSYSGLFGNAQTYSNTPIQSLDLSALAQARTPPPSSQATKAKPAAPTAPWDRKTSLPNAASLAKLALSGASLISPQAASKTTLASTTDYGKLFTVYQGISGLTGLANALLAKNITDTEKAKIQAAFEKGRKDIATYLDGLKLEKLDLSRGQTLANARTTNGVPRTNVNYQTAPIFAGTYSDAVPAFAGDVQFDLAVKRQTGAPVTLHIDLSEMGDTTRSMAEVVAFINQKLADANLSTRFDKVKTADTPKTIQANGKPITLPAGPDKWSLSIKGVQSETLTFSAKATADAVYISQKAGIDSKPTDQTKTVSQQELLKFQSDDSATNDSPPDAFRGIGEVNYVDGRVFSKILPPEITSVVSSQTAADGSVYLLANVNAKTGGQTLKGSTDVALLKYDSAGKLVFTRTLGAAEDAKGMTMAVSSDGKIAIAGSVTGQLDGVLNDSLKTAAMTDTTNGKGSDPKVTDSFVTVFNDVGEELWTRRRGTTGEDEAQSVSFGSDNTLYVAGRTKGAVAGATNLGGWDSYLRGYAWQTTTKQVFGEKIDPTTKAVTTGMIDTITTKVTDTFATQFGTSGDDKAMASVADGNAILVASKQGVNLVLRRFEIQADGTPLLTASRDLGDLQGGDLAGMALNGDQLVLVGSTRNAGFSGANITNAAGGGMDAFGLNLSKSLTASTDDKIAFMGGSGDDYATAMTVSNGRVWMTGTSSEDMPDLAKQGTKDGFIVQLNIATGEKDWSRRFTAKDGAVSPSSISVASGGASVLDRLGLPSGQIAYTDSTLLSSATSVRPGDSFRIRSAEGAKPSIIVIEAGETLATLSAKIKRVIGAAAKIEIVTENNQSRLKISPADDRKSIELMAGPPGQDALESLGMSAGLMRTTKYEKAVRQYTVGLNIDKEYKLDTKEAIQATIDSLSGAAVILRNAYRTLATNLDPVEKEKSQTKTRSAQTGGPVPTYLKTQIANYQAGLNRLTGGG